MATECDHLIVHRAWGYKVQIETEDDYRRLRIMTGTIYQPGWRGVMEQLDTINERLWTKQNIY